MSIPIGATGLSFSSLNEIRDSAKTLLSLASTTGLDDQTQSLSLSLLKKIDALSTDIRPQDLGDIERLFSELKRHLEDTDPAAAKVLIGNIPSGGIVLDNLGNLSAETTEDTMDFEKRRSGAGAAAWLQIQHAQFIDIKRSGNADKLIQGINAQIHADAVADVDLEKAESVLEEIRAHLVDGISGEDEIRALKKLLGSVPGLAIMFPSIIDDLQSALTEYILAEINDMSPEDARDFIKEVVSMLSEAAGVALLSEDEIETLVQEIGDPTDVTALTPFTNTPIEDTTNIESVDLPENTDTDLMSGTLAVQSTGKFINPVLMAHAASATGTNKSDTMVTKVSGGDMQSNERLPSAKDPLERVRDILSAMERLFSDKLNDSGSVLETVLSRLSGKNTSLQ